MKYGIIIILVCTTVGFWLQFTNQLDKKRMDIEYCWDSNGEHYLAPNEACTH